MERQMDRNRHNIESGRKRERETHRYIDRKPERLKMDL
jgi:hypothetical protein